MYSTIKAHKYAFSFFIFIIIVSFFLFYEKLILDKSFSTLLVSVTLTYSLFLGLLLWLIENRYSKIRENMALVNSKIQMLYALGKQCNKEFFEELKKSIDNYLVSEIEHNFVFFEKNQGAFHNLISSLEKYKATDINKPLFGSIIGVIGGFSDAREMAELYSKKIITGQIKILYNLLTFITIFIFVFAILSSNSQYSFVFIIYLFFFVYFTYFIKDIDNMNVGKISVKHHNRKQLFEMLGQPPFCANQKFVRYNAYNLKRGERYRIRDIHGKITMRVY